MTMTPDEALSFMMDEALPFHVGVDAEVARVLAAEVRKRQWIPVGERLPEAEIIDGEVCQFVPCLFYGPKIGVCAGRYWPEDGEWISLQGVRCNGITHWMPLPEPPK